MWLKTSLTGASELDRTLQTRTISMSAIWVKVSTILCLCCTAEMKGVVWKEPGQSITIQCNSTPDYQYLNLRKGLHEETHIYTYDSKTRIETTNTKMTDRIQTHGNFPRIDILIRNLNRSDTGVYWCVYSKISESYTEDTKKADGSVLLIVSGNEPHGNKIHQQPVLDMIVVYIVIAVAVLLVIMLGVICWTMHKTKASHNTVKRRRMENTNDVYEDMRGTIRR